MKKIFLFFLAFNFVINICSFNNTVDADTTSSENENIIAYAELGTETKTNGMDVWLGTYHIDPTVKSINGIEGWLLNADSDVSSANIYIDLDDDKCYNLCDKSNFEVEVEYYEDNFLASLTLEYADYDFNNSFTLQEDVEKLQKRENRLNELEILETQDTFSWKTKKWFMPRPTMKNTVGRADFRIGINSDFMQKSRGNIVIKSIKVRKLGTKDLFDVNVKSNNYGNIFYTGDNIEFEIEYLSDNIENNTPLNINIIVKDENGNLCLEQDIDDIYIKKGHKQKKKICLNNINLYNYYTLDIIIKDKNGIGESRVKKEFSYVRSFKGNNLNPTLGINVNVESANAYNDVQVVKNAGFSGIREYYTPNMSYGAGYGPNNLNKSKFAPFENKSMYIDAFSHEGLKVIDYLGTNRTITPGFYRMALGKYASLPELGNEDDMERYYSTMEDVLESQNAGDLISGISVFQIDNELHSVQPVSEPYNGAEYSAIHKYLYPKLKKMYPNVKISTNGNVGYWDGFGDLLERNGLFDNTDIYAIHPYTQSGDPITYDVSEPSKCTEAKLYEMRKGLDDTGHGNIELYATEWGYSSRKYQCPGDVDGQLAYLPQSYLLQMDHDLIDYSFVFTLSSRHLWQSGEHQFGINRAPDDFLYRGEENQGWVPGAAKPAYVGMAQLNCMMYDHKFVSRNNISSDTILQRWYKTKEKKDMITFFTKADGEQINIDLGTNDVTLYDVNGNSTEVHSDSGIYSFEALPFVKYVVGNFTKYKIIDSSPIRIESNVLTITTNSQAIFTVNNATSKDLRVDVIKNTESPSKIECPDVIHPGKNNIVITAGDYSISGDEDFIIKLYDDEHVYLYDNVVLRYCEDIVSIDEKSYLSEDGIWHLVMNLHNNTDTPLEGKLIINTKQVDSLFDDMDLTLNSREVKLIDMVINKELPDDVAYLNTDVCFNINNGQKAEIQKRVDLTAINYRDSNLVIDADLSDWSNKSWIKIDDRSLFIGAPNNPYSYFNGSMDISAKVSMRWDEEYLYFAGDVTDDVRYSTGITASQLWSVDNVQLGIVYDPEEKLGSTEYEELSFGEIDGKPELYRHYSSSTNHEDLSKVEGYKLAVKTVGNHTYYELMVPWSELLSNKLPYSNVEVGKCIKVGIQLNDNDGNGRKGIMIYGWGTGGEKDSKAFTKYYIVK